MCKLMLLVFMINTVSCEYKYETKWFNVPLDHFGYQRNESFNIKYLTNEEYWDKGGGPIFFYTGNEGKIEMYAQQTGFMWDIAAEHEAKLVFAEHRYYGQSMPFGNKSLDNEHIGYLTAAQALADYADLINYLQGNTQKPTYPVIAFGGSYGGILAAYFRIKYPHLVIGAIASSAPVHIYPGMIPCEVFYGSVTSSFKMVSEKCSNNIRNSWSVLRTFLGSQTNSDWLYKNWNLCDPIKTSSEVEILMEFLQSMYETLAKVNYPFPSDVLRPLPAHPVFVVCQYLKETLNGQNLIEAIGEVLQIYSNYDQKTACVNYKKVDNFEYLDATSWYYQACTEIVVPMCTNGKQDMFEPSPWNITKYSEECYKKYNVYPRPDIARIQYGGDRLQAASNIVFSNGLLDPWAGGGILNNITATVKAIVIMDAAHRLDLMPSNSADPNSVKIARNIHKQNIKKWIREFHSEQHERQI